MSGVYSIPIHRRPRFLSASAAFLAHAVFFAVTGFAFSQPAEYGIQLGGGGLEVHLMAAPAAPVEPIPAPDMMMVEEAPMPVSEPDEIIPAPAVQRVKPEPVLPKQVVARVVSEFRGEGSTAPPGKDSTTLHTMGGAETSAKPNYLKNPPPRYPEEARRAGQEGVVLLSARVTGAGRAESVRVEASSGFPLLDEAARQAVGRWRFQPARMGSLPVDSDVQIPVRFQLEKN